MEDGEAHGLGDPVVQGSALKLARDRPSGSPRTGCGSTPPDLGPEARRSALDAEARTARAASPLADAASATCRRAAATAAARPSNVAGYNTCRIGQQSLANTSSTPGLLAN